jgi:5-methylcytosine-specific restriction endonuclease McrA
MDKTRLDNIPDLLKSLYCEIHKDLKSSSSNRKFNCKCNSCKSWNTLRNFYKRNTNEKYRISQNKITSNYRKNNPKKHSESNKKWYHENIDSAREINRRASRKRNALKKNNGVSFYTENEVIDIYGTKCHICKNEIDFLAPRRVGARNWQNSLHIDHVVPISKGGKDSIENVKPSHALCNIIKNAN